MAAQIERDIPIGDLDKAAVLAALYNNSRIQGMGFLQALPGDMTVAQAREELKGGSYFDYLHGKVMKVNLSGDTLNPSGYDRDNGEGAARRAIESLRTRPPSEQESIEQLETPSPISFGKAIPCGEIVDRLKNLPSYMPAQLDQIYEFGRLLAERIGTGDLAPMGFNMAAELLLYDLQTGIDGFTGKPMDSSLLGYPPIIYKAIRLNIPAIAKATCPAEFAQAVTSIVQEIMQ